MGWKGNFGRGQSSPVYWVGSMSVDLGVREGCARGVCSRLGRVGYE